MGGRSGPTQSSLIYLCNRVLQSKMFTRGGVCELIVDANRVRLKYFDAAAWKQFHENISDRVTECSALRRCVAAWVVPECAVL